MSDELKPKKRSHRRRAVAASSPAPLDIASGPDCGHEGPGCKGSECGVRYVGPTTRLHDHHAIHAARGVSHVWTAAIVSGLAVVLTGTVAWTAVDAASSSTRSNLKTQGSSSDYQTILKRLDDLDRRLADTKDACLNANSTTTPVVKAPRKADTHKNDSTSTTSGQ